MKRKRFTEEQIIGILKQAQAGMKISDLCRLNSISDATFYTWRSKFGGMDVSDVKRLKCLEEEKSGNREFRLAGEEHLASLQQNPIPEVRHFIETFCRGMGCHLMN